MAGFDHPVLQHHQLGLQAQQFTKVADALAGLGRVGGGIGAPAVVKLQFQFFVHAVQQVFAQLAHLVFVDGMRGCHGDSKHQKTPLSLCFVNP